MHVRLRGRWPRCRHGTNEVGILLPVREETLPLWCRGILDSGVPCVPVAADFGPQFAAQNLVHLPGGAPQTADGDGDQGEDDGCGESGLQGYRQDFHDVPFRVRGPSVEGEAAHLGHGYEWRRGAVAGGANVPVRTTIGTGGSLIERATVRVTELRDRGTAHPIGLVRIFGSSSRKATCTWQKGGSRASIRCGLDFE